MHPVVAVATDVDLAEDYPKRVMLMERKGQEVRHLRMRTEGIVHFDFERSLPEGSSKWLWEK